MFFGKVSLKNLFSLIIIQSKCSNRLLSWTKKNKYQSLSSFSTFLYFFFITNELDIHQSQIRKREKEFLLNKQGMSVFIVLQFAFLISCYCYFTDGFKQTKKRTFISSYNLTKENSTYKRYDLWPASKFKVYWRELPEQLNRCRLYSLNKIEKIELINLILFFSIWKSTMKNIFISLST